ncbi:MAG: Gfo/Idh/MocA family oxidoreductase, partial [Candidatus Omnitrophica bacterium]|nr:Gfo/Idh/MocA family oxidoreductase [Candidatus Omnitrophota bacterium]
MKIIFFGLGSIGNRHAKIMMDDSTHELIAFRSSEENQGNLLNIEEVYSWDEVRKIKPDIAFITNPTFLHVETAIRCARLNMKLFVEKPIGSSLKNIDLLLEEVKKRKLVSYVAYNLRFHPVIFFLKEYLKNKKVLHVNIFNSSYLPDWRQDRDYRKYYSVSKEKGGGVILDLSHEFDYVEYLFGGIKSIKGDFGRAADITEDAEDFMNAIVYTGDLCVNLHQNLFRFNRERTIKIDCSDEFIFADLIAGEIKFIK